LVAAAVSEEDNYLSLLAEDVDLLHKGCKVTPDPMTVLKRA
jgi:hypothetical protein